MSALQDASRCGLRARLVTISDADSLGLGVADFNRRCSRLSSNLKRSGLRWERYVATLGICPSSGRLHRHMVTIGGPYLHRSALREHAHRAGLGNIDARQIGATHADHRRVANYIAADGVRFAWDPSRGGARVQPFSRSHSA